MKKYPYHHTRQLLMLTMLLIFTTISLLAVSYIRKPFSQRSEAIFLDPNAENVLTFSQIDAAGKSLPISCANLVCQLINQGPVIVKINQALLSNTALPAPTSVPTAKAVQMVGVIGDSMSVTQQYPTLLNTTYQIPVVDSYATIGSQTGSYQGSGGRYVGIQSQLSQLLQSGKSYDYVIVFGGVNDFNSGTSLSDTEKNLEQIYKSLKQQGFRVMAITVLPWKDYQNMSDYAKTNQLWSERTIALNNWLRQQVNNHAIDALIDAYGEFNDNGALKTEYSSDGLHLNQAGNAKLAEMIIQHFQR
ncbi:SGNH/GDSL hydrolase family protein [Patescibacteria group bacterium]|nr:SGNH/GDSL hydrolase family protein [Patescibacteria group bacterium]MCL5091988.1 SGNH/GDSL hydrolase family protein [Patescibacteria group bacterium]